MTVMKPASIETKQSVNELIEWSRGEREGKTFPFIRIISPQAISFASRSYKLFSFD